ncbi:CotH kinase family protein [Ruminiclostridium herbifermentans]|uniref:CotH kinase family protein n=2 Tax=Ruminiclostridium herbifermentans TaxID=2488810 RepID=A0A4U7JK47_9FIRM|nr:CotH kinase family protein [Ruminiclostridium herbifermentans]
MKMYLLGTITEFPVSESVKTIFINEIMASNTTLRDGDIEDADAGSSGGAYSDWIELYNSGNQAVDLRGYTLSDSSSTWEFPSGVIPAKGYLLVWASDKNKVAKDGQLHTNFKLSASGEEITLKAPNGSIIDSLTFPALKDNESYGRKTDASSEWVIFSKASPSNSNINSSESIVVKEPAFSHNGGFYTSQFNLQLTTNEPNTKIYYTLNGSDPVPGKQGTFEYTSPILVKSRAGDPNVLSAISNISNDMWSQWRGPKGEVFKCTTIKAVAIKDGSNKSKIITHSYFVDQNIASRYNLPVISLVTDQANFFDNSKGIYVNGNYEKKGEEWERPVHIEFFEKDGTLAFSDNSGIRINGGYTRKIAQKSLRLYAGHDYDDVDSYKYEIFPGLKKKANGKKLDKFETLILRNAGNDNSGTFFRDALIQSLVSHLNVDTMAYRPSVVFLDGEFWGIYNIRERYDNKYLKAHYNLDKNKVIILDVLQTPEVSEGEPEDYKLYQDDVINYLKSNNIRNTEVYENIKTKIDIENYINYNVTQIYCGNTDWPGNNVAIWKYKTDDGKYHPEAPYGQDGRWRWMLKDTDFGFGYQNQSPSFDSIKYATSEQYVPGAALNSNSSWAVFLLKTLIQNTEFRNQFINAFADQLNTSFIPSRVTAKVDELKAGIQTAMPEHCDRWQAISMGNNNQGGGIPGIPGIPGMGGSSWDDSVKVLKNYAEQRPSYMRQAIVNNFRNDGVTGTAEINISTNTAQGYVKVNSIDIKTTTPGITNASSWTGIYFKGVPVTLKAIPNEGYKFDHWEGISGVTTTSDTITFNPTGNVSVRPVFTAK